MVRDARAAPREKGFLGKLYSDVNAHVLPTARARRWFHRVRFRRRSWHRLAISCGVPYQAGIGCSPIDSGFGSRKAGISAQPMPHYVAQLENQCRSRTKSADVVVRERGRRCASSE